MLDGISLFLIHGYSFYFDSSVTRQSGCCHCCSCRRILTKESSVNLVHRSEVLHVCKKNCRLYNLIQTAAARFQYGGNVLQDLFGLFPDTTINEFASGWINRNLT